MDPTDGLESRPIYQKAIVPVQVDGKKYLQTVLHFSTAVLPLVMNDLESPEEWQLADFGAYCVMLGPLFASTINTAWKSVSSTLRHTPDRT